MVTVYKDSLQEDLMFRRAEMRSLLNERENILSGSDVNPFKEKSLITLNEVIRECSTEINEIQKKLRNSTY